MNKSNFIKKYSLGKSKLRILLLSSLVFANLSSVNQNTQSSQNLPAKFEEIKKSPNRIIVDFEPCVSREDIINLIQQNHGIKTINPADYFLENENLLSKLGISDAGDFYDIYTESDIMRYAVYTQLAPKSEIKNINKLNSDIAVKSDYTNYIYIKNILTLKNFNLSFDKVISAEKLAKELYIRKKREKANPGKKYKETKSITKKPKIHKDINKGNYASYQDEGITKIPRREANRLLSPKNILINSSSEGFDEIGNNKTIGRTCLHGIAKNTLDFLLSFPEAIQSEYSGDIIKYKPIVVTGVTEDGHMDKEHIFDHPSGSKFDMSIRGVRGVILAKYFAKFGITKFNHIYKDININGFVCDIYIHDGGVGIHFDILVKSNLTN